MKIKRWYGKARSRKKVILIAIICVVVALGLSASLEYNLSKPIQGTSTSSSYSATNSGSSTHIQTATSLAASGASYVTSSPPNSSQWLILRSVTRPVSISANNTGTIPPYASASLLNQTKIGSFCVSTDSPTDTCASFEAFFQTGWYWDPSSSVLYIHYVGGPSVKIVVRVQGP